MPHSDRQRSLRKMQVVGFAQQWERARAGAAFEHHKSAIEFASTPRKSPATLPQQARGAQRCVRDDGLQRRVTARSKSTSDLKYVDRADAITERNRHVAPTTNDDER